jgi:hypothetical protein
LDKAKQSQADTKEKEHKKTEDPTEEAELLQAEAEQAIEPEEVGGGGGGDILVADAATADTASSATGSASTAAGGAAGTAAGAGLAIPIAVIGAVAALNDVSVADVDAVPVSGGVVAGPVLEGNDLIIELYEADGVTKIGEGTVDADGSYLGEVESGYTGVVIARVRSTGDADDYFDEALADAVSLTGVITAVGVLDESGLVLYLTPLTTIAASVIRPHSRRGGKRESRAGLRFLLGRRHARAVKRYPSSGG